MKLRKSLGCKAGGKEAGGDWGRGVSISSFTRETRNVA